MAWRNFCRTPLLLSPKSGTLTWVLIKRSIPYHPANKDLKEEGQIRETAEGEKSFSFLLMSCNLLNI